MNCTILSYVGKYLRRLVCCCDLSVTKLCLTLLRLHGLYSAPGSSVHGISQARILEWVATFSSPGHLPHPRIKPVSPALQVDSLLLSQIQIGLLWFWHIVDFRLHWWLGYCVQSAGLETISDAISANLTLPLEKSVWEVKFFLSFFLFLLLPFRQERLWIQNQTATLENCL